MFYLNNLCSLCLAQNKKFTSQSSIESSAEEVLQRIVPEFLQKTPGIQRNLCDDCLSSLNAVSKFRRKCLRNIIISNDYVRKLQSEYGPYKYLAVTIPDIKLDAKKEIKEEIIIFDENICYLENDLRSNYSEIDDSIKQEIFYNRDSNEEQEANNQNNEVFLEIKREFDEDISDDEDTKSDAVLSASSISDIENAEEQVNEGVDSEERFKCTEYGEELHNRMHDTDSPKFQKCQTISARNKSKHVRSVLKQHEHVQTSEKPHSCDICGKKFTQLISVKLHRQRVHYKEKSAVCNICGKGFFNAQDLRQHNLSHSDKRYFKCDICQKSFKRACHLKQHKMVHSDVNRFRCNICEKTFSCSTALQKHKNIHNNKTPYSCTICTKYFRSLRYLERHKTIHTGAKPFSCDVCPKKFNQDVNLRRHKRIHDGIIPSECGFCGKLFIWNGNLKRHERMQHAKNSETA